MMGSDLSKDPLLHLHKNTCGLVLMLPEKIYPIPSSPRTPDRKNMKQYRMEKYPPKSLPYRTSSICPLCFFDDQKVTVVDALVYEANGKIMMTKQCSSHGAIEDVYWLDAGMFKRAMAYWYRSVGLANPRSKTVEGCPLDCGLCPSHKSHTALGLIDITNRCNIRCPVCFANSAATGNVYEPEPQQVFAMLKLLRENLPIPCPAIQFAGGEPTLSDHLPTYIQWAKELGFAHIMVATNGIRMAKSVDYIRSLREAGMNTIYLQFDGISKEPYLKARQMDLRDVKAKALKNCYEVGVDGIILVPTIIKGVNHHELGDIIRFGVDNRQIVKCINFQPVSITGRINYDQREAMRITLPEAIHLIQEQTNGVVKPADWYPVPSMLGIGRALGLVKGTPEVEISSHFACGMATFIFIREDGSYYPITDVVNLEELMQTLEEICELYADEKLLAGLRARVKLFNFMRTVREHGFMRKIISTLLSHGDYSSLAVFMSRIIMLGMMHFMDPWNLDLERLQHCDINYATPDDRIIPFCSYNILYRPQVEERFSTPVQQYRSQGNP